ncbi:hypothetical protein RKE25_22765 (plasmid) [Dyella sp. BiH032]|uniref:hypothetical protein n=1 Tax=Dyella sp. BiH032 TaxID=3075430 RepID=UPI0028931D68|nr:hypothetical protein [Dyella sp. BiH032]WNL48358.1 hypothetical protein RKE25_22765 [Dyella sp. BiH032]
MKSSDDSLVFPSGRSVARARQDAKRLAKKEGIPLNEALDRVAFENTRLLGYGGWAQLLELLRAGECPNAFPVPVDRAPKGAELDIFSMASLAPRQYPWDHWERIAIERGVSEEMASLGRAVMREHYQHSWDRFGDEVSMHDAHAPRRMIDQALVNPEACRARWTWLLATDGDRVDTDAPWAPPARET